MVKEKVLGVLIMTLSYDCVQQNWFPAGIEVGETVVVVEKKGEVLEIVRLTEEYCKVRQL